MKRWQFFSLYVGLVGAFLILSLWLLKPVVWTFLLEPITALIWALLGVALSVDQEIYWVCLIAGGFILGLRSLRPAAEVRLPQRYRQQHRSPPRVDYWRALLEFNPRRPTQLAEVRKALNELRVTQIAQDERLSRTEAWLLLSARQQPLLPHLRTFPPGNLSADRSRWPQLRQNLAVWKWRFNLKKRSSTAYYQSVDEILACLEREHDPYRIDTDDD